MANPVAELEIPVKFEFSGKEFTEGFNKQINSLTRDYKKLVKNIFGLRIFSNIWSLVWAMNVRLNSREDASSSFMNIFFISSS